MVVNKLALDKQVAYVSPVKFIGESNPVSDGGKIRRIFPDIMRDFYLLALFTFLDHIVPHVI